MVAAEGIIAFGAAIGVRQDVKIARLAAVIQDHLLIKFV
jgi:hypothetical protein